MHRRAFVVTVATALLTPLTSAAQHTRKRPRIGFLQPGDRPSAWVGSFLQGLRELNYVEGENILVEYRVARGPLEHRPLVEALIALNVDVLVTWTTPAVRAARDVTSSVPIVGITGDPVQAGLVHNLARPGGNVTGIAILTDDLMVKSLELFREALPAGSRIAVLSNPDNPVWTQTFRRLQEAAPRLAGRLQSVGARRGSEIEAAFAAAIANGADAILVVNDGLFTAHRQILVDLAASRRLPMMFADRAVVEIGGLMSYGVWFPEMLRRLARYVDNILRGAKPSELPVEQATKFELAINLKTARALGLTIPPSVLLRAHHVIE